MKTLTKPVPWLVLLVLFAQGLMAVDPTWRAAEPGWRYEWPRDHGPHREFKTEWWYFTGNVRASDGRRFGYELTFFRSGLRPPGAPAAKSRFAVQDLKIAHFALTNVNAGTFVHWQIVSRGAFDEAGNGDGTKEPRLAWLGEWSVTLQPDGSFQLAASEAGSAVNLTLQPVKAMVAHGQDGVSRKAAGPGHASHYYSATRLKTRGTISVDGILLAVEGESWFDHEWATNQLAPEQKGWDWFSLQFNDGSELMIYQLRRRDGTADPASSGTWIAADGTTHHLHADELKLTPVRWWQSKKTGGRYPIGWRIEVPALTLVAEISTPVEAQELVLQPISYWEGLIDARATRAGKPVTAHGYLELTGYAGEVVGLSIGHAK
jgi:predicted secreted hydrolase